MDKRREPAGRVGEAQAVYEPAANASSRKPTSAHDPAAPGYIVLGPQRRMVLPTSVTEHLGVRQGDTIVYLFDDDGSIRLASLRRQIGKLRGALNEFLPTGTSLAAELIAERHAEARREAGGS